MRKIFLTVGAILSLFPMIVSAQVSGSLWKLSSSSLLPINSSWSLTIPQLGGSGTRCVQVDNTGLFAVAAGGCSGAGGAWPFTSDTNFGGAVQSTTTAIWDKQGLQASSTSQFLNLNIWSVLTLKATTSALLGTDINGNIVSTTTIGTNLLSANTISGVALGGNLFNLSHDSTLSGSSYNGSSAISNWGLDLTHSNIWTGLQQFSGGASSTVFSSFGPMYIGNTSGSAATTTIQGNTTGTSTIQGFLNITGTNSTSTVSGNLDIAGNFREENIINALQLDGTAGVATAYSGSNCSANTFAYQINGAGVLTCQTVALGSMVSGILPIANGGTATSTQVTNGVNYFDGTKITSGTALSFDGTSQVNDTSAASNNPAYIITATGGATAEFQGRSDKGLIGTNSNFPFSFIANSAEMGRITVDGKWSMGTTTPGYGLLTLASSTIPQLSLGDNTAADNLWSIRSVGNNLYIATSSATATSSKSAFYLDGNGIPYFPSLGTSGAVSVGAGGAFSASTLSITSGGTNATSCGTTNAVWYYDGTRFVCAANMTYNGSGGQLLTVTNASTTNLSVTNGALEINGYLTASSTQPATSTSMTLDWANSPPQIEYQIGNAATTIKLINATTSLQWGSRKLVWICNVGGVAGALTWGGVEWIGTAPTQTTTSNQCDAYSFDITRATSTSAYKVAGTAGTGFQ